MSPFIIAVAIITTIRAIAIAAGTESAVMTAGDLTAVAKINSLSVAEPRSMCCYYSRNGDCLEAKPITIIIDFHSIG